MKVRFNKETECQQIMLDHVTFFLENMYPEYEETRKCKSLYDTYMFFVRRGYSVYVKCSIDFLLNPLNLLVWARSRKTKMNKELEKYAIVVFSSALELYGILDIWNHYVYELVIGNKRKFYDSYSEFIKKDYPDYKKGEISINNLKGKRVFIFYIWR